MKKSVTVSVKEGALVAATRAIGGIGIGLLLGNQLIAPERRKLGWALVAVGGLSTIPLAMRILPRLRES
jgi:hypothetical protein